MGFLKNTGILLISEVIAKGVAFLLIPLYSFVIDPKDFGVIAILQLLFTGFLLFVSFSLKSTFDKYYFDDKNTFTSKLITNLFTLQLLAIFFVTCLYLLTRNYMLDLMEIEISLYLDLVYFTSIIAVFFPITNSFLICLGKVNKVGIYSITISIIRSLFALILVLKLEDKILAVLVSNFIEQLVGFFISFPILFKRIKFRLVEFRYSKDLLSYSMFYFPTILSGFIIKFSDRFMIQYMLGYQSLGIYSMGTKLVNVPGQFISTLNKNFTPQMYQSIQLKNNNKFSFLIKFFLITLFVLLYSLILFSKEIFYLIGEDYKNAFIIFIILSFSSYINGYNLLIQPVMTYYTNYVKNKSIIFVSVGIINIILNLLIIPIYGIYGAAIVTTFTYLLSVPFNYYYTVKAHKGNYHIKWFSISSLFLILVAYYMIFTFDTARLFEFLLRIILFFVIAFIFVNQLVKIGNLKNEFQRFLRRKK